MDFKLLKAHLFAILIYTSKIIVDTEFVLCLVFKPEYWDSFLLVFINSI